MTEKLFSWLPNPLFSSGIMVLRSDARVKRQIVIGPSTDGEDVTCYRVDEDFGQQEKTYLLGSSDPEGLALTYERALLASEEEGYIVKNADRPKVDDVAKAVKHYAGDS